MVPPHSCFGAGADADGGRAAGILDIWQSHVLLQFTICCCTPRTSGSYHIVEVWPPCSLFGSRDSCVLNVHG